MGNKPAVILLLDDHEKTRNLYKANLEAYTGAIVISCSNLDEASSSLQENDFDIVITRAQIEHRDAAKKLFSELQDKSSTLMVIGNTTLKHFEAQIFHEPMAIKTLVQACAKQLNITPRTMFEKDVGEFYPIPLPLILPGFQLICPTYKMDQHGNFILLLEEDQHIYQEVIILLKNDGVETIYVKAKDRLRFINSLTVQTTEFLKIDRLNLEEKIQTVNRGHEIVRNMAKQMMMDQETIELAQASVEAMFSIVNQVKTLKQVLEVTHNDHMSFMYRHCLLTTFIACHIIKHMEWGTRDQQTKIAFVAFFHDIALNDDKLCMIHTQQELEAANLSEEEYKRVEKHALCSAKFLAKYYSAIPLGAEVIIKQHHGSRTGIGFGEISQNISPLAIVFLIAEEWAIWALRNQDIDSALEREKILNKIRRKFDKPGFKKVIATLEKLDL